MRDAAIDEMHAAHAGAHGVHGAVHFRDHAFVDDTLAFEVEGFADVQARNQGLGIAGVAHQAGDIAHEHEPTRADCRRKFRGGDVGIDIVGVTVFTKPDGANHGRHLGTQTFAHRLGLNLRDLANITQIDAARHKFATLEYILAGKTARLAAEFLDRLNDVAVDHVGEHVFDDLHRFLVGYPHPVDELGVDPRLLHRLRDRLAAAVNDDRVDAHGFEKNHVRRDTRTHFWIRGIHEAAAVFDDKCGTAEALHVWQCFHQHVGLFNQVLHATSSSFVVL